MPTTFTTTTTVLAATAAHCRTRIRPGLRGMLHRLVGRGRHASGQRRADAGAAAPAVVLSGSAEVPDSYVPGAAVWAYIAGAWLPARVTDLDGNSAIVTYQVPGSGTPMVETVHRSHLRPRHEARQDGCGRRGAFGDHERRRGMNAPFMMLETVTPPIGSIEACGCGRTVVWDEVHGWMHIRDTTSAVPAGGHLTARAHIRTTSVSPGHLALEGEQRS